MPPYTAGSAHLNAPESTSGVASATKPEEGRAIGKAAIIQRQINLDAEASSGHTSLPGPSVIDPFIEGFNKRRRVVHETTLQRLPQQPSAHASFGSDSVRALFNYEPSAVTSGQVQPNRSASMSVSSKAMNVGPGVPHDLTG